MRSCCVKFLSPIPFLILFNCRNYFYFHNCLFSVAISRFTSWPCESVLNNLILHYLKHVAVTSFVSTYFLWKSLQDKGDPVRSAPVLWRILNDSQKIKKENLTKRLLSFHLTDSVFGSGSLFPLSKQSRISEWCRELRHCELSRQRNAWHTSVQSPEHFALCLTRFQLPLVPKGYMFPCSCSHGI